MLQALPCGVSSKQSGRRQPLQCNMHGTWWQDLHSQQDACCKQARLPVYGCMLFTLTSPTECDVLSAASSETVALTLSSVTEQRDA